MKRICRVLLSTIFLLSCVAISGCTDREDCIPKTLGKAEGLYLYYDNYRSLTDGTQTERLLCDITVNGETYTEEEYEISQLAYMTSEKEIFYCLETQKEGEESQYFLWHYNYDTKENGCMRTLERRAGLYTSDMYLLLKEYNGSGYVADAYLYDGELNCVAEDLADYNLSMDMVYRYTDYKYFWWKNGQSFSVEVSGGKIDWDNSLRCDKYEYLFIEDKVYMIDLDTGEYQIRVLPNGEKFSDAFDGYGKSVVKNGLAYFITYTTVIPTAYDWDSLETGCALWALNGMEMQRVHEFEEKYEVTFSDTSYDERYINVQLRSISKLKTLKGDETLFLGVVVLGSGNNVNRKDAYYDISKKKVYSGEKATTMPQTTFTVGEYEFYTSSKRYGPMMGGGYCYYLHRITDGKDEIIQYFFDEYAELNPILFEDICIR